MTAKGKSKYNIPAVRRRVLDLFKKVRPVKVEARKDGTLKGRKIWSDWIEAAIRATPEIPDLKIVKRIQYLYDRDGKMKRFIPSGMPENSCGVAFANPNHVVAFHCKKDSVQILDSYKNRYPSRSPFRAVQVPSQTPNGCGIHALLNFLMITVCAKKGFLKDPKKKALNTVAASVVTAELANKVYELI